ncbi:hypothetical protein FB388_5636 [Pseudonocardia cypriaca]|uniref:Uncharacterized protein n=1 Tax=Pseudonocardia cypriaca TaxID=882449 RepID=A0A543FX44_9PSEU|nr:hypothetical protein FB388_5636 [Pseudonocardia cypriaca]
MAMLGAPECPTPVLNSVSEVMGVSFVHGHPRRTGWVMGHVRRPNRAAPGQLPLLLPVPLPRPPAEGGGATKAPASGSVRSARKAAITRS